MNNLQSVSSPSQAIDDSPLSHCLKNYRENSDGTIVYVYAKHKCKLFKAQEDGTRLVSINPEKAALKELTALARANRLKRIEVSLTEIENASSPESSWKLLQATVQDVKDWHKSRENLFKQGRGKATSNTTAASVWHDAGGRCMYRGCAQNLGNTPLTTKPARIAYLAHIIASDPDGPRGNDKSHELSDAPENIMLMCDAHHRLIDRIDEAGHPIERLQSMRSEHTKRVNDLLESLKYPRTQIFTLLSDLAQISTHVPEKVLQEALLNRNLGVAGNTIHAIRRTQRDDRNRQDFWWHFLHEHENDIRDFIRQCSNHPSQSSETLPDRLAIFPLHLVPVLFMAGRIVGEARRVELFQYDQDRESWVWNEFARPEESDNIYIDGASDKVVDEVVLSLELTAKISIEDLPDNLVSAISEQNFPWVRIHHKSPNPNCIQSYSDLKQFAKKARQAVQLVQDKMNVKRVHLIGVSPASTIFRFGQFLQAGHHPPYQLYDRADWRSKFTPAFTIEGTQVVTNLSTGEPFSISLR